MWRIIVTAGILLLTNAQRSHAIITEFLNDEFDGREAVSMWQHKDVEVMYKELDLFKERLRMLKERDIEALFGKPVAQPAKIFAMPLAQPRVISRSGLTTLPSKEHREFYVVGKSAGLEVLYWHDGDSPVMVVSYLRVDDGFEKLTEKNLARRLAWDRERLQKMYDEFERKRVDVFPWEVDFNAIKKLRTGEFDEDAKARLEFWTKAGKEMGLKLVEKNLQFDTAKVREYEWHSAAGKTVREARSSTLDKDGGYFKWLHADNRGELRSDEISHGKRVMSRWCRKSGGNIRYEWDSSWVWYDKGGQEIRHEWDDNHDGIPDFWTVKFNKDNPKSLSVDESWAVNPKLIPVESRTPHDEMMKIPLRRTQLPERLREKK